MLAKLRLASLFFSLCLLLACGSAGQTPRSSPPAQTAFSEKTASNLILNLSETLEAHNQKRFLALFDIPQMREGGVFRQQINLLFTHTELIRVHMNLVETSVEDQKPALSIDAELDAQPVNGPAWRRNDRLTLTLASSGGSWKVIDVQPRSFFSLP